MSEPSVIYMIVVESADGYNQENHAPYRNSEDAEAEAVRLRRVLGDDSVVQVEEHEVL